jgi:hypothetical protein
VETHAYRVRCGEVVSITLEAEDSCLADNFDPQRHPFSMQRVFHTSEFDGDVKQQLNGIGFSQQGWLSSTSFRVRPCLPILGLVCGPSTHSPLLPLLRSLPSSQATAVRGTNVRLEVQARDECGNVGSDLFDPSRECDGFVAGKCCPPVISGPTRYQQVLALFLASVNPLSPNR